MRRVTFGRRMFGGSATAPSRTPATNRARLLRTDDRAVATRGWRSSALSPAMRPRKLSSVQRNVGTT